jgi:hypothetical protein
MLWGKEKYIFLPEIETRPLSHPARRLVALATELPRFITGRGFIFLITVSVIDGAWRKPWNTSAGFMLRYWSTV